MSDNARASYLVQSDFERLEEWCRNVRILFDGEVPYLVGSAMTTKDYRDVDVRLLLADEEFATRWYPWEKIRMINRAVSIWGQEETGLPIDFQIQKQSEANEKYGGQRNPMGTRDWSLIPTQGVSHVGPGSCSTQQEKA